MKKLISIPLFTKIIIEIIISYLILSKGETGRIIHDCGTILHQGNALFGLFCLFIFLIAYLAIILFLTIQQKNQFKIMFPLCIFDIILIFGTLLGSIFINTSLYEMPLDDAIFKFVTLADGASVVFIALGFIMLILIKKHVK